LRLLRQKQVEVEVKIEIEISYKGFQKIREILVSLKSLFREIRVIRVQYKVEVVAEAERTTV
jgi:hypothetical protein